MKKIILCFVSLSILIMVTGPGAVFADTKAAAEGFLEKMDAATPVSADDNKSGFNVKSITKSGDDYIVAWHCTNSMIADNSGNQMYAMTKIHFIDPEDYNNHYQPFVIADGKIDFNFEAGDQITPLVLRVKFEPKSKIMFMYFSGVPNDGANPPELYTVPLFYTLILGDNPAILDNTPRHANKIFDGAIAK